jgi:hypothetical protein
LAQDLGVSCWATPRFCKGCMEKKKPRGRSAWDLWAARVAQSLRLFCWADVYQVHAGIGPGEGDRSGKDWLSYVPDTVLMASLTRTHRSIPTLIIYGKVSSPHHLPRVGVVPNGVYPVSNSPSRGTEPSTP